MTLHIEVEDSELADFRQLMLRALNTWGPKDVPAWAYPLADRIDQRIATLKKAQDETPPGQTLVGVHERPGNVILTIRVPTSEKTDG